MERSGAAQGLAEVLGVLGTDYVNGLLPDILQSCTSRNPYVREGHLTLFKFLPGALSDIFQVLCFARSTCSYICLGDIEQKCKLCGELLKSCEELLGSSPQLLQPAVPS